LILIFKKVIGTLAFKQGVANLSLPLCTIKKEVYRFVSIYRAQEIVASNKMVVYHLVIHRPGACDAFLQVTAPGGGCSTT
jgi:hypothetical protein